MLLTRNLMIAVGLATMLALVISFLPRVDTELANDHTAVFQPTKQYQLEEDNLVDVLSLFQSQLAISHVQWQNNNLFIDYRIDKEKPIYVDEIYEDLFSTLHSAYSLTNNVKGLYISILYRDKGKNEVLIALSAERSQKLVEELIQATNKKEYLQKHTTITHGVLWKESIQR